VLGGEQSSERPRSDEVVRAAQRLNLLRYAHVRAEKMIPVPMPHSPPISSGACLLSATAQFRLVPRGQLAQAQMLFRSLLDLSPVESASEDERS
jgi:hypothetical protein